VNAARGGVVGFHPGDSSVGRVTKPSGELPIRRSEPQKSHSPPHRGARRAIGVHRPQRIRPTGRRIQAG
jgi:hypothetical protein